MRTLVIFVFSVQSAFCASAFLCDNEYFLQGVQETYRAGSAPEAANVLSSTMLNASLQGIRFLSDSTEYRIISGFRGACSAPAKQEVTYKVRSRGTSAFSNASDSLFIKMFSGPLAGTRFALWFGLGPDTAGGQFNLETAIGSETLGPPFCLWYATTVLIDSVRSTETGLWQTSTQYYRSLFCYADSARLDSVVFADWRAIPFDANHRGHVFAQFLKAYYDTIPASRISYGPTRRTQTVDASGYRNEKYSQTIFDPAGRALTGGARRANGIYLVPSSNKLKVFTRYEKGIK